MASLSLKGIYKRYAGGVTAVNDFNLVIKDKEFIVLVGPSGCGKTTTGRSLLRLYEPTGGRFVFDDEVVFDVEKNIWANMLPYRKRMQIVFQDPYASLDPRMTVGDIVGEAIDTHKLAANKKERYDIIIEMLRRVGLNSEHANRYPHEFSGGQRQRIGIARAVVMNPELIIADEPISALDVSIQAQVINLLNELSEKMGLTILFIAHDLAVVKYFSHRIAVMYFGKLVELATSEELFKFPFHPYTKSLLSAIPIPDPRTEKNRKRITYNPMLDHDYSKDKPTLKEVYPGHFVLCNNEEFEKFQKQYQEENK